MKMFNGSTNLFLYSLDKKPISNLLQSSWKDDSNMRKVIVAKNVKNSNLTTDINANCITNPIEGTKKNFCSKANNNFKAQPINHYRKQYISSTSTTNNSFIGSLDKPGNNIFTLLSKDQLQDNSFNSICQQYLINNTNNNCLDLFKDLNAYKYRGSSIIKTATTVLDPSYCSSHKELLYKKCKTFNQNLPLNNDIDISNGTTLSSKCLSDQFNCRTTFNPSNKRYQVQGPISSSSRIAALRYDAGSKQVNGKAVRQCLLRKTDYNNPNFCPTNLTLEECKNQKEKNNLNHPLCITCNGNKRQFRGGMKPRILS
jgi:hypothetical protein